MAEHYGTVQIQCYGRINRFLARDKRYRKFSHTISRGQTTKDMIESEGIPHVEIDCIIQNRESVNFQQKIQDNDSIEIYSSAADSPLPSSQSLMDRTEHPPRFILDVHLRSLARKMRLLGLDVNYEQDRDDPELAQISVKEHRILLTRDRQLLMRKIITQGAYVYETDPDLQIREVIDRFTLKQWTKPFSRCTECNGLLNAVDCSSNEQDEVLELVPPGVRNTCTLFFRCSECKKIYWHGSHIDKIKAWMQSLGISEKKQKE